MNRISFEIIDNQRANVSNAERALIEDAFLILERAVPGTLQVVLFKQESGAWAVMLPNQDVPDPWKVEGILLDYLEYARGL